MVKKKLYILGAISLILIFLLLFYSKFDNKTPQANQEATNFNNFYYNFTFINSNVDIKANDVQVAITLPEEEKEAIKLSETGFTQEIQDCKISRPEIRQHTMTRWVKASGMSMYPCYDPDIYSEVEIAYPWSWAYEKLQIGDVVKLSSNYADPIKTGGTMHRLVQKTENGWITKGDYNNVTDFLMLNEQNYGGIVVGVK